MNRGAALVFLLAAFAGSVRAEDPPPAAGKPAPSWKEPVVSGIAVSRDGAWLGGKTSDGYRLFPTAGGEPIALEFPKDERAGYDCAFTPDSKWFVAAGESNPVEAVGIPKDRTQAIYFFSVAAPSKRKAVQINLKAEGLDKDVKRYMDPKYRNMKTLKGAVMDITPFAGSKVLFDRGDVGVEMWDAQSASKTATPAEIDGGWSCGISADASKFVRVTPTGLEIRDAKANRALLAIKVSDDLLAVAGRIDRPRFASGGSDIVAAYRPQKSGDKLGEEGDYVLRCWSTADGKQRWEAPIGRGKYVAQLEAAEGFAVTVIGGKLNIVDLRDGSLPAHPVQGGAYRSATPSADGKSLWVVNEKGISRAELPELEPK